MPRTRPPYPPEFREQMLELFDLADVNASASAFKSTG